MSTAPAPVELSSFDPFSLEFRNNPVAAHSQLLRESPGFIMMEGVPSAYVAGHAQVLAVLRDWQNFTSVKPKNLPGMERVDFFNSKPVMNYSDPPQHDRLRKVIQPVFTPRRMQAATDEMARIINSILDKIGAGEKVEITAAITKKLAYELLLTHFLGVEEKDHPIFFNYISTLYLLDKLRPGDPKPQAFLDAWDAGTAYCREMLQRAARGENPDNAISLIYQAMQGDLLSDDEVMAMMLTLLTGGAGTLGSSAASSLYHMAANPQIAERVREDATLAKTVLEEALRFDPPVTLVMRFATNDVQVGTKTIRAGMPVYVLISVANRDPSVFPQPNTFGIDRENMRQLSFGFGIHNCIGNSITRATVSLLIEAVAKRYPNLRIDPEQPAPEWETTPRSRHIGKAHLLT
jgi:cytochrome P450